MNTKKYLRITNANRISLIYLLKKKSRENKVAIWREIAGFLSKSKRARKAVNISKINRITEKDDQIIVPGKVLGSGILNHPITVAAFDFSKIAKYKIIEAKGKCLSITELIESNPKGANIKIVG
jgi:large subunit ribosomal protein L18e